MALEAVAENLYATEILGFSMDGTLEIDGNVEVVKLKADRVDLMNDFMQPSQNSGDWMLLHHDHFDDSHSLFGWNIDKRSICEDDALDKWTGAHETYKDDDKD